MKASAGDRIVVRGRQRDEPVREGKILEAEGAQGDPPYWVEWSEDGHISLFFPSPDTCVEHDERRPR
ncbi:MAG: DUF1918 domain-containing protein [Actinomycetes bacterium]